jgi:uncharacterized protein YerC
MNVDLIPGDIWDEYGSLQKRSEQVITVAHNAWAIEDQLNTFLDSLINNSLPREVEKRRKQSTNLGINRQRKHLHRFRLLEFYATIQSEASVDKTSFDQVLQSEQLSIVRSVTTSDEWRVLLRLAREEDYKTIAEEEGVSIPALKTRVSRCRCRLRGHLAA